MGVVRAFLVSIILFLIATAPAEAGCVKWIGDFFAGLPWNQAKANLVYALKIKVIDRESNETVAIRTFSTVQGTVFQNTERGETGFLVPLNPITRVPGEIPSAEDLSAEGSPDGTFSYLKVVYGIVPVSAWKQTGEVSAQFWNYHKYEASKSKWLGGVTTKNNGSMKFQTDSLQKYRFEIETRWVALNDPFLEELSYMDKYASDAKAALEAHLKARNHFLTKFVGTPIQMVPGEEIPFGPTGDITNKTNQSLRVYVGDSGFMGARYTHAVALNPAGKVLWIETEFVE